MLSDYMDTQIEELQQNREYELAEMLIDRLIDFDPINTDYQIMKASVLANARHTDEAQKLYEELYAKHPDEYMLVTSIVSFYKYYGDYERLLQLSQTMKTSKDKSIVKLAKELESNYSNTIVVNGNTIDRSRNLKFESLVHSPSIDTIAVANHLSQWEKEDPNDPEMMVAWAFYYTQLGINDMEKSDEARKSQEAFGNAFKVTVRKYNTPDGPLCDQLFKKSLCWTQKAIAAYPDRFDLYIYQAETCYYLMDEQKLYDTTIAAIERSKVKGQEWVQAFGAPIEAKKKDTMDSFVKIQLQRLYEIGSFYLYEKLNEIYFK